LRVERSTPCAKAIKTIFHFSQTATSTDKAIARQNIQDPTA
jgi:hypothetical protein